MRRLVALGLMAALQAQAADEVPLPTEVEADTLPLVSVRAKRLDEEQLPPDKAVTVIDEQQIARLPSDNVYDILKNVPGVGVAGGPRASGMRFTLRGFTDNEDVTFKIDGAVKGFEKYRFGGGVFLEPELLKALAVERGPSVQSGSGALGGTISATTKSAADLLRPGERAGALAKLGWGDNNRERLRMLSVFGRPHERIDLMAAIVKRDSQDIRLPDGARLPLSATHSESRLVKIGLMPLDSLLIELGNTRYLSGPEATPYDATGGPAGVGGVVRREIDDETTNLRFNYEPSPDFTLRGMAAREKTHLHDRHVRGEARICAIGPAIEYCDDDWQYDIFNAEVFADLKRRLGPVDAALTLGAQTLRNEREVRRVSSNERINELNWPGGFNSAQPPGDKHSEALIADARFTWGRWTLSPGLRWDRYEVIARGGTRDNMLREGEATEISFAKAQPSVGLSWQIPNSAFALTARYNQAFRPPLIDQYFSDGSGNAAIQTGLCMRTEADPITGVVIPLSAQPFYDKAGIGKPYDPALDHAPLSGICGALYRPQESVSRELTLAWAPPTGPSGRWYARLTTYRIRTHHLLSSLQWLNGRVEQPGVEWRRGTELEARWSDRRFFADLNLSTVRRSRRDESALQPGSFESNDIPPDSANATLGLNAFAGRLETGWRVRHFADRRANAAGAPAICLAGDPDATGMATHKGATLNDLFANWKLNDAASLRASIDNLDNRDYCLASAFSGAVGFHAPGRAAKVSVTVQF